jgi:putative transposase
VANARSDFLHKLSRRMVDENQAIVLETLGVRNMMKNRSLSRAISGVGWTALTRMIEYKAEARGVAVVRATRFEPSSKTCHACLAVVEELPLDERTWTCAVCGTTHDRDLNAALNLKRIGILELKASGLRVSARGGRIRPLGPPDGTSLRNGKTSCRTAA